MHQAREKRNGGGGKGGSISSESLDRSGTVGNKKMGVLSWGERWFGCPSTCSTSECNSRSDGWRFPIIPAFTAAYLGGSAAAWSRIVRKGGDGKWGREWGVGCSDVEVQFSSQSGCVRGGMGRHLQCTAVNVFASWIIGGVPKERGRVTNYRTCLEKSLLLRFTLITTTYSIPLVIKWSFLYIEHITQMNRAGVSPISLFSFRRKWMIDSVVSGSPTFLSFVMGCSAAL